MKYCDTSSPRVAISAIVSRDCSDDSGTELLEVVVEVAVDEGSPVFGVQGSEGGVGLELLVLASGGEFVDGGAEGAGPLLQVAFVGDDEFRGRRGSFRPGEPIDDQLLHGPDLEERLLRFDLEFAHRRQDGDRTVLHHLRYRHLAPLGRLAGGEFVEAGQECLAVGGVPDRLGHSRGIVAGYANAVKCIVAMLGLLALPAAAEKWTAYRSAPFTVYTNAGEREAREALVTLVQLQHTLSEKFGKDLQPIWPVAVVERKNNAEVGDVRLAGDSYLLTLPEGPVPPAVMEALALRLLRENTATMDPAIERGVARVFSTLEADGPRVTVGAVPKEKDLDWARMHLLLTDSRYNGTAARVLLANFGKGVDGDAAWRNTVGMLQRDFDKEARVYLAAGKFGTAPLNGKPIDPRRIRGEELEPDEAALLVAQIAGTEAALKSVVEKYPEYLPAREALGVLTGDKKLLAGAKGARALAAMDTKESLEKAWRLNPRWSLPHQMLAKHETKLSDKAQRLRKAAEISPRDVAMWQQAAEAFEAAELPAEASKMWFGAERAAASPSERARLKEIRLAADRRRLDAEAEERRKAQEEEAREIQRLKDEALTRIREAEAKANGGATAGKTTEVVEWWDGPKPDATERGKLLRVECLKGNQLRLAVGEDLKTAKVLLVKDAGKIVVTGNGTVDLGCGVQKTPRMVTVEYVKATGEVSTVTFTGSR